jgi:hypothetical protein
MRPQYRSNNDQLTTTLRALEHRSETRQRFGPFPAKALAASAAMKPE